MKRWHFAYKCVATDAYCGEKEKEKIDSYIVTYMLFQINILNK